MLLWVVFSALTAGVVGALLWSSRPSQPAGGDDGREADVAVYADQLAQVDDDRAKGLLTEAEAQAARAEIGRRLLNRSVVSAPQDADASASGRGRDTLVNSLAIAVPLSALVLYVALGSPGLPGLPHAQRSAVQEGQSQIEALIAKVEQRLREAPEDGNGWDVIGPIYLRMERYGLAAIAFANANRLLGETPKRLAGFAQSEILANGGTVTPNARAACERLLALEPKRLDARLWLTLAKEQDGALADALTSYRAILGEADVPPEMRSAIEDRIAVVEGKVKGEPGAAGAAAPAPEAAKPADVPAQGQQAFIEAMVARLAARLQQDGKDSAGWVQLLRSYMVLGRKEDAAKAYRDAKAALAGDAQGWASVEAMAKELGVTAGGKDGEK